MPSSGATRPRGTDERVGGAGASAPGGERREGPHRRLQVGVAGGPEEDRVGVARQAPDLAEAEWARHRHLRGPPGIKRPSVLPGRKAEPSAVPPAFGTPGPFAGVLAPASPSRRFSAPRDRRVLAPFIARSSVVGAEYGSGLIGVSSGPARPVPVRPMGVAHPTPNAGSVHGPGPLPK